MASQGGNVVKMMQERMRLTTETIQSTALSFQSIDDIERRDSLALGMLSVCDCVPDNALKECLENTSGFFVDH